MPTRFKVLTQLQDGRFHSGEALAKALTISRASVWKAVEALRTQGLDVQAVSGKGYRLAQPLELLDRDAICHYLWPEYRKQFDIQVHHQLDSTNAHLLNLARSGAQTNTVCLAEYQTAGRGRRGRQWVSPLGANLYLSLLLRLQMSPQAIAGFSLVCGIALVRALQELGIDGVGLKWPNDLVWQGRKLAGILLELSGEAYGESRLIIGFGINVCMPEQDGLSIDQPWVDLAHISPQPVSRNQLAAALLNHLSLQLTNYQQQGMAPFVGQWMELDSFLGERVELLSASSSIKGVVRGIDEQGSLLLETSDGIHAYQSGEVSLRGGQARR